VASKKPGATVPVVRTTLGSWPKVITPEKYTGLTESKIVVVTSKWC